jgi:hypothetical protein
MVRRLESKVAYGYVPRFKEDPVFLFAGDSDALHRLAQFFESLMDGPVNVTRVLDVESLFLPKQGTRLTLTITEPPTGMRRIASHAPEPRFEWRISKELATRFAELTKAVASSELPAHQYLDTDGNNAIAVMVSKGEYDEGWLQRQ